MSLQIHTKTRLSALFLAASLAAWTFASVTSAWGQANCRVRVAFEQIGVPTLVPVTNAFHAVVLIDGAGISPAGFEGNPTEGPPTWGTLYARERNMARSPLKALWGPRGMGPEYAGRVAMSCTALLIRMRGLVAEINAARLPYAPIPEVQWNAVNSNSFAYWAVRRIGLKPPPAPWGTQPYGYDADISGR
jgi:hypothetical protein